MATNAEILPNRSRALPDELSFLLTAFLPSKPASERSKAYLTLSSFCQGVRNSSKPQRNDADPNTEALVRAFSPLVVERLADTDEDVLLAGVSFLAALFQVDWQSGSGIFGQDGVLEAIMDSVDLDPSTQLARSVAQLLSQACGHKPCRAVLSSQAVQWLNFNSRNSSDMNTRAGATTALIKISKGSDQDNMEVIGDSGGEPKLRTVTGRQEEDLAGMMREIVVSQSDQISISDAIEGLAYLSVAPHIKELLSRDVELLKRLSILIPRHKITLTQESTTPPTTFVFGVLLIVSNLCAYRPRLTEEQAQIEKLREMAKGANASANKSSSSLLDDDEHVKARVQRSINAGLLDVFPAAMRTSTKGIQILIAKALLSIVEDKDNRGKVLQAGGAKVLLQIIKGALSDFMGNGSNSASLLSLDPVYLGAIQALAKLTITASPIQVFGPNEGVIYDVIRPFSLMLQDPSSTLLQKFESMMALTNLSSQSAEVATRIGKSKGLLDKAELLLFEDHTLIRRAAMELVCNLVVGSDAVFEIYGGGTNLNSAKSKLQVVLAMSNVGDTPTRLAASGALATLTSAPNACSALVALQLEKHRVFPILAQLIDSSVVHTDDSDEENEMEAHPGLVHRSIICTRNIFLGISDKVLQKKLAKEAGEAGLTPALLKFVTVEGKEADGAVLQPAVEVLHMLQDE